MQQPQQTKQVGNHLHMKNAGSAILKTESWLETLVMVKWRILRTVLIFRQYYFRVYKLKLSSTRSESIYLYVCRCLWHWIPTYKQSTSQGYIVLQKCFPAPGVRVPDILFFLSSHWLPKHIPCIVYWLLWIPTKGHLGVSNRVMETQNITLFSLNSMYVCASLHFLQAHPKLYYVQIHVWIWPLVWETWQGLIMV